MVFSIVSLTISARAWFMFNRDNTIRNNDIVNRGDFDYTFTHAVNGQPATDHNVLFENIYPGDVHKYNLSFSLTNNDDTSFYGSFFFAAPSASQEVPYVDTEGNYYYLGSQIQITKLDVALGTSPVASPPALNSFLVTTSSSEVSKGQNNSVSAEITSIPDLYLLQNIEIPGGATISFDIDFTFVDNGTSQNVYMSEWPTIGHCSRTLKVHLWGDN